MTRPSSLADLATIFDSQSISGTRNRIINGNMYVAQRATSATVTAGTAVPTSSTGYPCIDRFFAYCTGANVTAAQVSGSGSNRNLFRITGVASVTAVGIGQRIETLNSIDLAGQTCTLSVDLSNSLLTTVTWTASYATTTDTFGTIGTPTKTQIATGTFTVSSTLTRYSVNIAVPAAATTGIEILFTVGAQTSGTWEVGNVQFEAGPFATPFERRQFGQELALCQRYFQKTFDQSVAPAQNAGGSGGLTASGSVTNVSINASWWFACPMRATPTIVTFAPDQASANWSDQGGARPTAAVTSTGQSSVGIRGQTSVLAGGYYIIQATASAEL